MIYYADKFKVYDYPCSICEYEVLNELKSAHRSDDNCLYHTRFLFESDSLPLADQIELARKHRDNIMRVTFSGKKSIHVIVEFPSKDEKFCREYYKLIWQYFNREWFGGNCDRACANPSRLTRRPNVVRKDTGKEQKLLFNGGNQIDEGVFEDCYNQVLLESATREKWSELTRRYRNYMGTNDSVDCSTWNVVKRYLETPFPHMTGNGNSSSWLYAALQTCKQYNDERTLQLVIDKAKSENWTEKEIQHKLK